MSIPKLTTDFNIIQKLSDLPNSTEGLTAEQLKSKFDEAGLEIQRWINETLVPAITAGNIPFPGSAEVDAETVEEAILAVQEQIAGAASGAIIDGTVTKAKLAAALLERVYGGRSWVALGTPDSTHNPNNDFPVGQIWLRPAFTVKSKNTGNWLVSGCSATVDGHNVTMTGTQTVSTATMTQTISGAAQDGDRIYVLFDVGSMDSEITEFSVSVNGDTARDAAEGGVFTAAASGSNISVVFRAVWPSASLAKGSAEIKNLTIVNVDEILRSAGNAKDMKNWAEFLRTQIPFEEVRVPDALYIQKKSGEWWLFGTDMLPVSRGGTGVAEIGDGELLYGKSGGFARLAAPEDVSILGFSGGAPDWTAVSTLANYGYARIATGSYVGTGEERTIQLPVEPKLLVINEMSGNGYPAAVFQQGTKQVQSLIGSVAGSPGSSSSYKAGMELNGNTLTPFVSGAYSIENPTPGAWNGNGVTYPWFAIY